jgi:type IV pilus assembly protein PilC
MPISFVNQHSAEEKNEGEDQEDASSPGLKRYVEKIDNFLLRFSRVPLKEKLFFVQHLGLMLKSGISLSVALKTLADQTKNKYFQYVLNDMGARVERGESFADSLAHYPKVFGELFVSMVEAGEMSGKLEDVLHQIFLQMKKEHTMISKVKGALTYPAVIVLAMFGIGVFMMVMVVPRITDMFTQMEAELPLPTKILIGVSDAITENGILSLIGFIVFIAIIAKALKTYRGKYIFQAIMLKFPVMGPIVKKINLARFARNISSLLKTDIMIIKTFQITAKVLGNLHYRHALEDMAQKIQKGGRLHEVIQNYPHLFTPVVVQMVAIGEETGELDNILVELAEFYEEEVNQVMENLPSIIEPLLILMLGLGVGAVAVAILLPMYTITSTI